MPRIQKHFDTGTCQMEFELDENEFAAIGRVMVQWAFLEQGVYEMSAGIAEVVGIELPENARSTAFSKRLRVLRDLVTTYATDDEKKRMLNLIDRVANVEQDRHQVAHGTWEWEPDKPDLLRASCLRPGKTFEKLYHADRIHAVANRIGQLSFDFQYPGGWDEAWINVITGGTPETETVSHFSPSRDFVRRALKR